MKGAFAFAFGLFGLLLVLLAFADANATAPHTLTSKSSLQRDILGASTSTNVWQATTIAHLRAAAARVPPPEQDCGPPARPGTPVRRLEQRETTESADLGSSREDPAIGP